VPEPSPWRRRAIGVFSIACAAVLWLPCVHLFFDEDVSGVADHHRVAPLARSLANRQLQLWTDPALRAGEVSRMRRSNAEWDFMGRAYVAWSLANLALRDPSEKPRALEAIDHIVDETLALEKDHGFRFFMLPYADAAPYLHSPERSLFVDSEIAMMIASRRLVEEKPAWEPLLAERVDRMVEQMSAGPVQSGESYPDECWTFDNANALAAIHLRDVLDGTDHRAFIAAWIATAKTKLTDPASGILVSSYTVAGKTKDGPEGSTIWMVSHALGFVDEGFAADQYGRARTELARSLFGFGYAREWPASWKGPQDIDSGVVIPILEASPSSSGLAVLGASSAGDMATLRGLLRSLAYGGFPTEDHGGIRYAAGNQVGDAVLLYALTAGPVRDEAARREAAAVAAGSGWGP
jgi:hypothetical protein